MKNQNRKRGRPKTFYEKLDDKTVKSLDKAMILLKAISQNTGLSLTDIFRITDITPPTAYRALTTMQQHKMVYFDQNSQTWSIGSGAYRIGSSFLHKSNIIEQARPIMQSLMETLKETVNIGIRENADIIFLSQVETHEPIRAFHRPGSKGIIYASGIGKALFAYLDELTARQLLDTITLKQFTIKTMTDIETLIAHRLEIRKQGFSFDDEEHTLGMRCVASPIFNVYGEAVAAISISGPSVRISDHHINNIAAKVIESAAIITEYIGGQKPDQNHFD